MTSPLILITNDDGYQASGIRDLARAVAPLGDIVIVAPDGSRSGAAASISSTTPVSVELLSPALFPPHSVLYSCTGTPVDCIKLALERIVPRRPDLILSGINHGDNASISIHYSGTMGAVLEGCMKGIPSIGFSLWLQRGECYENHPLSAQALDAIADLCRRVILQGLPQDVCLNVNFPADQFRGCRVCRQARGSWSAEWFPREDGTFQLTGQFTDLEPEATDTDFAALRAGYASIVPVTVDMTAHNALTHVQGIIDKVSWLKGNG